MSVGIANQTDGGMARYGRIKRRNFRVTWLIVMNILSFREELRNTESFTSGSLASFSRIEKAL